MHFNCQKNFYCHHFHYYLAILDWTWPLLQPYYGVCVCVWYLCTRTFCVRVCINFNFIFIQHSPIAQCSPLFPLIIKRKNFFHLTRFYIIAHFENPAVFFPNYSWAAYLLMNNDSDSGSIHFWSLLVARYDPGWLQKRKKIDSERFSFIHWFSCQRVFFFIILFSINGFMDGKKKIKFDAIQSKKKRRTWTYYHAQVTIDVYVCVP